MEAGNEAGAMKRVRRRFMNAFAQQLGKSAAHGLVVVIALLAVSLMR